MNNEKFWSPAIGDYYARLNEISSFYGRDEFKRNDDNVLVCNKLAESDNSLDSFLADDVKLNADKTAPKSAATQRLGFEPSTEEQHKAIDFRSGMGQPNVDMAYNVTTNEVDLGKAILQVSQFAKTNGQPAPCFVYYHGGDFVGNGSAVSTNFSRKLAELIGGTVINVDYRLAPEVNADELLSDCWSGVQYAANHANELGIDKDKIFVAGDSAGGNIAAEMSYIDAKNDTHLIAGAGLIYPMIENDKPLAYEDIDKLPKAQQDFLNGMDGGNVDALTYLDKIYAAPHAMSDPIISPYHMEEKIMKKLPRTMVIAAEYDSLRPQDYAYAKQLAQYHIDVEYLCYGGLSHGLMDKFGIVPQAEDVARQLAAWTFE